MRTQVRFVPSISRTKFLLCPSEEKRVSSKSLSSTKKFPLFLHTLTFRAPRVLVPTPSTKGVEKDPPQYLKNEKCYKPETFGGVRSFLLFVDETLLKTGSF